MTKEICQDCGEVYEAGPHSFLCPQCRKRHISESAKKRNLSKLGRDARTKKGSKNETRKTN